MNIAYQTEATRGFHPMPVPTHSPYLPTTVALSWGAFLLDGVLQRQIAPYTYAIEGVSPWSLPFYQLIEHNNHVLLALADRVKDHWQHPLMLKPALFNALVVNGIGDYIARYLIEYHGAYPPAAAYCAQIDMYLGLFFPDFKAPSAQSYVLAQQQIQSTHSAQGVHS